MNVLIYYWVQNHYNVINICSAAEAIRKILLKIATN